MLKGARASLPYRETADCFLMYKGKVVCKDMGHYVSFPGGGVDPGETVLRGAKRECMEEVGARIGKLHHVITINWDWFPEWADTPKRKERYAQFRGEKIHLLAGDVTEFVKPTSTEGDAWTGRKLMALRTALAMVKKYGENDHPNMACYRVGQETVLKMLAIAEK